MTTLELLGENEWQIDGLLYKIHCLKTELTCAYFIAIVGWIGFILSVAIGLFAFA
jgi:hypothetical protein